MPTNTDKTTRSWSDYHVQECIVQLCTLRDSLSNRILPTFMSVEKEGDALAEKEFNRLKTLSGGHEDPDYDSSGDAQKAEEARYDYFALMTGLRQSIINTTAVCLHHLFEQQLLEFLQREIKPAQRIEISNTFRKDFETEVAKAGPDVSALPGWADANILRLTANTIKHAEGRSAEELRKKRPDLFAPQGASVTQSNDGSFRAALRYPAFGDLFVTLEDIDRWTNSLSEFWRKLGELFSKTQAPLEF